MNKTNRIELTIAGVDGQKVSLVKDHVIAVEQRPNGCVIGYEIGRSGTSFEVSETYNAIILKLVDENNGKK